MSKFAKTFKEFTALTDELDCFIEKSAGTVLTKENCVRNSPGPGLILICLLLDLPV